MSTKLSPPLNKFYQHKMLPTVTCYVNAAYAGMVWFTRRNSATKYTWRGSLTTEDFYATYEV